MTSPKPNTTDAVQAGREEQRQSAEDQLRSMGAEYAEDEDRWYHLAHRQQWLSESPTEYLGWVKGYDCAVRHQAETALSEPRPVVDTGEAVGWRWRLDSQKSKWTVLKNKPVQADWPDVICEPLFTTPDLRRAEKAETERDKAIRERDAAVEEMEDLKQVPWPEWIMAVLAVIRKRSGYDGYDDAREGIDLPAELEECFDELEASYERERAAREKAEQEAAGLREVLKAVDQHDRSNFHADTNGKAQRSSWRGVMRKVRAALQAQASGQTETGV